MYLTHSIIRPVRKSITLPLSLLGLFDSLARWARRACLVMTGFRFLFSLYLEYLQGGQRTLLEHGFPYSQVEVFQDGLVGWERAEFGADR
jgi:hypothetical protein